MESSVQLLLYGATIRGSSFQCMSLLGKHMKTISLQTRIEKLLIANQSLHMRCRLCNEMVFSIIHFTWLCLDYHCVVHEDLCIFWVHLVCYSDRNCWIRITTSIYSTLILDRLICIIPKEYCFRLWFYHFYIREKIFSTLIIPS